MARDDHTHRVLPHRPAHGTRQCAVAEVAGQRPVGCGLAEWDGLEQLPNTQLDRVAAQRNGHVERRAVAGEVFVQLRRGLLEQWIARRADSLPKHVTGRWMPVVVEVQPRECVANATSVSGPSSESMMVCLVSMVCSFDFR